MKKEILYGLGLLILGVVVLWWNIKKPVKNDMLTSNFKGYIAGFFFIIIGVLLLIGYGKL